MKSWSNQESFTIVNKLLNQLPRLSCCWQNYTWSLWHRYQFQNIEHAFNERPLLETDQMLVLMDAKWMFSCKKCSIYVQLTENPMKKTEWQTNAILFLTKLSDWTDDLYNSLLKSNRSGSLGFTKKNPACCTDGLAGATTTFTDPFYFESWLSRDYCYVHCIHWLAVDSEELHDSSKLETNILTTFIYWLVWDDQYYGHSSNSTWQWLTLKMVINVLFFW
jgi:hypothetical protein